MARDINGREFNDHDDPQLPREIPVMASLVDVCNAGRSAVVACLVMRPDLLARLRGILSHPAIAETPEAK